MKKVINIRKKIILGIVLIILVLCFVPTALAGNMVVGWVKHKLGVSNPTHQCYVELISNEECGYSSGRHICQLYRGYDPSENEYDQCEFCLERSAMQQEHLSDCIKVGVERSHFAGEDLIGQIVETKMDAIEEEASLMEPSTSKIFQDGTYMLGAYKDFSGELMWTTDGVNYYENIMGALDNNKAGQCGWFDWFGAIFKRKLTKPEQAVYDVYENYGGKSEAELEAIYEEYVNVIGGPPGTDFPAKAIVELLKQGKRDGFLKAVKGYHKERRTESAQNMRQLFHDGELASIERLPIGRDFQPDVYLFLLEDAYHRYDLAVRLERNTV